MQEETISSLESICGPNGCPLIGQTKELNSLPPVSQLGTSIDPTFRFYSNLLRFVIYLSVPVFLITALVCTVIICIKLFRKTKGLKPYFLIIAICVLGFVLSIFGITFITFITTLQTSFWFWIDKKIFRKTENPYFYNFGLINTIKHDYILIILILNSYHYC